MLLRRATLERVAGLLAANGVKLDDRRVPIFPDVWVIAADKDAAELAMKSLDKALGGTLPRQVMESFIKRLVQAWGQLSRPPASALLAKAVEEVFAAKPEAVKAGKEYKEVEGKSIFDIIEERHEAIARLGVPVVYVAEVDGGVKYTEEVIDFGEFMSRVLDNAHEALSLRPEKAKTWAVLFHAGKRLTRLEGSTIRVADVEYRFSDRRDAAYNYFKVTGDVGPFVDSISADLSRYVEVAGHTVTPTVEPLVIGRPKPGIIAETPYTPDVMVSIEVTSYPRALVKAYYEDVQPFPLPDGSYTEAYEMVEIAANARASIHRLGDDVAELLRRVNDAVRAAADALSRVESAVSRVARGAELRRGPLRFLLESVDEKHGLRVKLGAEYQLQDGSLLGRAYAEAQSIPEDVEPLLRRFYEVSRVDGRYVIRAEVPGDVDEVARFLVDAYKDFNSLYMGREAAVALVVAANAAEYYRVVKEKVLDAVPYSPRVAVVRAASIFSNEMAYKAFFFLNQVSLSYAAEAIEEQLMLSYDVFRVRDDGTVLVRGRSLEDLLREMGVTDKEALTVLKRYVIQRLLELNPDLVEPSPTVARLAGLDPVVVSPLFLAWRYKGKPVWMYLTPEEKRRYIETAAIRGMKRVLRIMEKDIAFEDSWAEVRRWLRSSRRGSRESVSN